MTRQVPWWRRLLLGGGHPVLRPESALAVIHDYTLLAGGEASPLRGGAVRVRLPGDDWRTYAASHRIPGAVALVPGSADLAALVTTIADASRLVAVELPGRHDAVAVVKRARDGKHPTLRFASPPTRLQAGAPMHEISVAVTGEIRAVDHSDAFHEHMTVAVSGARRIALPDLAGAKPLTLDGSLHASLTSAVRHADALLMAAGEATGAWLRVRSLPALARARHASQAASPAPGASDAGAPAAIRLAALADAYRVGVTVETTSAIFVRQPLVGVRVALASGAELSLSVSTASGRLDFPPCATCGRPMREAEVCAQGHLRCAACALLPCQICAGTSATPADGKALEGLSMAQVAALPSGVWSAFIPWLLREAGWTIEHATGDLFTGKDEAGHPVAVLAPAPDAVFAAHPTPTQDLIGQLAALPVGTRHALVSPFAATAIGGIELLGATWIATVLAHSQSTPPPDIAPDSRATATRAKAAMATRKAALAALDAVLATLDRSAPTGTLTGQGALGEAGKQLDAAQRTLDQLTMIWQGIQADWEAAFKPRADAGGALVILADGDQLKDLRQRVEHGVGILREVARDVAKLPGKGEKGYAAWRGAVAEAIIAQARAARAGIAQIDPAQWKVFGEARPDTLANEAESLRRAAGHAAARAGRAQAAVSAAGGLMAG
ncbi:MAG TPA: hypothetical protein VF807_03625 [Ktedonobacterales bacterium]